MMDVGLLILLVLTTMRADLIISAHHYEGRLKGNHRIKGTAFNFSLFFNLVKLCFCKKSIDKADFIGYNIYSKDPLKIWWLTVGDS